MKLDLLTNATVVDDAIRFVSSKSKDKENLKSSAIDSEPLHAFPDIRHQEQAIIALLFWLSLE